MFESLSCSIEKLLRQNPQGLSEYELITKLQETSHHEITNVELQDPHQLFQIHFILFHCLYRLRDRWLTEQSACLQISALEIRCLDYKKSQKEELELADSLRSYYLDLNNLQKTDAEEAENLITRFWIKYAAATDREDALSVFELDQSVDFQQIKARYRQLAMTNHPDRGGSAKRLADINQAMETLKRYYQPMK